MKAAQLVPRQVLLERDGPARSPGSERSPSVHGPRPHVSWSPGVDRSSGPGKKGKGKQWNGPARSGQKGRGGQRGNWKGGR